MRAASRTCLAAAVVLAAAAAPAMAAWGDAERASVGPMTATSPDVALNARGDAAAVWVRGRGRARQIVASVRPLGGGWSRPEGISRRGRPSIDPEVGVGPDGRVVATWRQAVRARVVRVGGRPRAQAVYVARARELAPLATRWSAIVTLSSPRQKVGRVFLGVDGRGVAVAAWHWGTGTRPTDPGYVGQVQVAERPLGGEWGDPRPASQDPGCVQVRRPRVAVGASGHAVVWWQCDLGRSRAVAAAVARGPDEPFGAEARLPITGGREVAADMAVTPDGQAVAVSADAGALHWWRGPASAGGVSLSPLPALGTAEHLAAGVGSPQVAAGDAGDAVSGWIAPGRTTRIAPIAGDLGVAAPITLGGGRADARVRVAMGGARRGAVAWLSAGRVVAVGRGPDGNTGPRAVLSGRGVPRTEPPALAMDTAGDGLALWARRAGGRSVIERAGYTSP